NGSMETLVVEMPSSAEDWAGFSGHELDAKVRELDVAGRRVEAAIVGATELAERTGHFQGDGHRSPSSWLMATTNCTRGEATARVRTARMTRRLVHVAQEFIAGRVGVSQVRELARLAANPRVADQLPDSEDVLLDAAQCLEFADFRVVTARWEQLADADGSEQRHERAHDERNARCDFDGVVFRFETAHGVIQGTSIRNVFDAFCQAEFDRDWQWVKETYGDEANGSLLPRTAKQRRADASVAMVLAAASAGAGDGRSIDATVNLVVDQEQLEAGITAEATGEPVAVDPSTVRDRRCETTDGVPVSLRQMVAAALVGRIRTIVVDGAGVIVAAGRKRKLFTGALREAIQAIDPTCGWLGCNLRAQIAAIDHLVPRSRGGPTDASNAKIMCDRHNIFKHTSGYTVERLDDGTILITRPDGTHLRPPDAA
ncbi:MAG: DUF222 domain-containing protein, partial [Acidimicrobiia bacterium]